MTLITLHPTRTSSTCASWNHHSVPAEPDSMFTLNALKTVIESDDFHDYAMLIGAPRHDGYRQPSTTWLKKSICEFDSMRSCDIIEYVFSRNNYDKSRHADLHEFNSCDIIELVERTG